MKYIPAKTIITHNKNPESWFGSLYNMNIYRGCSHGCIYCDSRSNYYQVDNFDEVAVKENALGIIEKELRSKRKKGIVGTGAMSDPYNPLEKENRLTRGVLELIDKYDFGVNITTKSDLIVRDIDVLKQINEHSPVGIGITVTAADDGLSARIEPAVPASSKRLAAIKNLAENGIYTGILMMPILPFISDSGENILSLVRLASENGARFIYPWFGMTLRQGQREYFYRALDKLYPGLTLKYTKAFGDSYQCACPEHKKLWELFSRKCGRYGIVYRMPDIVKGIYAGVKMNQMELLL